MKLKITAIRDAGDLEKERVVMRVSSAGDIGEFVLIQTGLKDDVVTNKIRHAFWFPDKSVGQGDYITLYTKKGRDTEVPFQEVKSHFFYWGMETPIWDNERRSAVLLHAPEWEAFIR